MTQEQAQILIDILFFIALVLSGSYWDIIHYKGERNNVSTLISISIGLALIMLILKVKY